MDSVLSASVPRDITLHVLDHRPLLKDTLPKPEKADTTGIDGSYHDGLLARFEGKERIHFLRGGCSFSRPR